MAHGAPRCTGDALWREHPLRSRMTLDYQLHLFENMYKAGPHKLERGRLVHATPPARPLVVHFNGKLITSSSNPLPNNAPKFGASWGRLTV